MSHGPDARPGDPDYAPRGAARGAARKGRCRGSPNQQPRSDGPRRERSPSLVLTRVHKLLLELSQPTLFVTVFYGVVDGFTRTMTYVRAGHERPLLISRGKIEPLQGEGTVLGLLDVGELRLEEESVGLKPGDRLVLYTDGLIDALNSKGESFGLGRLLRLLETHGESSQTEMCQAIFTKVSQHQGAAEQYDDMTLLTLQVK